MPNLHIHKEGTDSSIILRPFNLSTDINSISEWSKSSCSNRLFGDHSPRSTIEELFIYMVESDYVKVFMVETANKIPLLQVDFFATDNDDISNYYKAKAKDYCINILLSPKFGQHLKEVKKGLSQCLEQFFTDKKVKRILVAFYRENHELSNLLMELGFTPGVKCNKNMLVELYAVNRDSF